MSRERTDVRGDYPCVTIRCDTPGCDEVTDVLVGGGDIDTTVEQRLDEEGWESIRVDISVNGGEETTEYVDACPGCAQRAAARELPSSGPVLAWYEGSGR